MSFSDAGHYGEKQIGGAIHANDDVVQEIVRWSKCDPSISAPPFLLSKKAYSAIRKFQGVDNNRFEMVSTRHRIAVDKHLSPILREIAEGRPASTAELHMLTETMREDPIQSAFFPINEMNSLHDVVLERIRLMKSLWVPFYEWWRAYFFDSKGSSVPAIDLWQLYIPFSQWIAREKRKRRPNGLFMIGFNGSPGAGKTVLTSALTVVLNHLLDSEVEGQAIARSGDDWYLSRSERELLKEYGYDSGAPGLSNRALPGTHDHDWLQRNLLEMERSTHQTVIRMGNFDKKIDDQPGGADRYFEVRGKVGVFLFDLWFAGAETDIDPMKLPDGLKRRVAENLQKWRTIFDRMDALWVYDWPSFEQMLQEREAQERLVEQRRGKRGMSREDIRAFMAYMIEQAWDWQTTSPIAPDKAITFRAWRDTNHRVIEIQRGGWAS